MIMYKTSWGTVSQHEIERVTATRVYFPGGKKWENRESYKECWHSTEKDAYDYLVNCENMCIAQLEQEKAYCEQKIAKLRALMQAKGF